LKEQKQNKKNEYSVYQMDGADFLTHFKSSVHQYAGWDINKRRNRERITEKISKEEWEVWNETEERSG
jgi:hypothetical protein